MDNHGNIVVGTELCAKDHPRVLIINDAQLHLIISIFHELCLLPVLKICHKRINSQLFGFGQADSRAHHVKPPDADAVGALDTHGFQLRTAGIVSRNNPGPDRVCSQRNIVRGLNGIIVNRCTVANRIDARNACLLTQIR